MSPGRIWFLILTASAFSPVAHAKVWMRARADGTQEFTNVAPVGRGWKVVEDGRRPPEAGSPAARAAAPVASASSTRSTVWARESRDGVWEFTNLAPVGARWKVLFQTGPGKASSVRGASDVIPARDTSPDRLARYDQHIRDQQAYYGIPQALVRAIIKTESDFDPHVVSSAGAVGLMQLMPETARSMGVTDIRDPRQNIMGGTRYLQTLARRYCRTPASGNGVPRMVCSLDEKVKVLAGYHAGPGAVDKYGGMPPYETTRSYVMTVLSRYEQYRRKEAQAAGPAVAER